MPATARWPTTSLGLVGDLRQTDDASAWDRFATQYRPALLRFCRQRGLQQADAEDIVQTVLLTVSRQMETFRLDPDRGRFRSWLATLVLRAIWKQRERMLARPVEYLDPDTLARLANQQQELLEEINESVWNLALLEVRESVEPDVWQVFERVWFDGQRPQAVASSLRLPPSWVYKAKFRVLERLKSAVRRLSDDLISLQPGSVPRIGS